MSVAPAGGSGMGVTFNWATLAVLAAALCGVVLTVWSYGFPILTGSAEVWHPVGYDQGGGLAVLRYYLDEPWGWRFLTVRSIGSNGVAVTLTDSNAILAVTAKILRPVGLTAEQWWALWIACLMPFQAAAGALAVRSFRPNSPGVILAGGVLAMLTPFFLFRVFHPALAAHGVILLSIACAGSLICERRPRRAAMLAGLLSVVAFSIHPYLGPMVILVVAAGMIGAWRAESLSIRFVAVWCALVFGAIVAILVLSGIPGRRTLPDLAGPIYNASPLGPVIVQQSSIWPGTQLFAPRFGWEGYSYVGLGGMLVIIAGALVAPGLAKGMPKVSPLFWAGLAAWMIAVSSSIWVGASSTIDLRSHPRVVWTLVILVGFGGLMLIPPRHLGIRRRLQGALALLGIGGLFFTALRDVFGEPYGHFTNAFRANGRFMWVVSYLMLVLALVALDLRLRKTRPRVLALLLAMAIALQFADTTDLQRWGSDKIIDDSQERIGYMAELVRAFSGVSGIELVPPQSCLNSAEAAEAFRDVVIAASIARVPVSAEYSARPITESCDHPPLLSPNSQLVIVGSLENLPAGTGQMECSFIRLVGVCEHPQPDG